MNLGYDASDGSLLNVDSDVLVYRIGFSTQEETETIALVRLNNYIDEMLNNSRASDYKMYLSCMGEENFRKKLYPHYKQGRSPKPKHYHALREYLIQYENAYVAIEQEADDELSINQTDSTICGSIDKDLDQVPGRHFNFVTRKHYTISQEEGIRFFWQQVLTGDSVDNIPGIYGIGPAKAQKMLAGLSSEEDYKEVILFAYRKAFPYCSEEERVRHINLIGNLVRIRKNYGEIWRIDANSG